MEISDDILLEHMQRVINKILFIKRKVFFEYEGISFFPAEIHLMLVIKNAGDINAQKIAQRLGVTKGAVSQSLSRLEKKGVLSKTKDPYKNNELSLSFTPFGERAFDYYQKTAAEFFDTHRHFFSTLTAEEKATIKRFMYQMEKLIDAIS